MRKPILVLLVGTEPPNECSFHGGGSLAVPGADEDATRTVALIQHVEFDAIYVTLDTHHKVDISHPFFWEGANGKPPPPMTCITANDVKFGVWLPRVKSLLKHCVNYLQSIDAPHIIWPEHCLIGTDGHNVERNINEALQNWSASTGKQVNYVLKGMNPLTEHFSVFKAEMPLENDPETQLNLKLIDELQSFDAVLVCGQALTHFVNRSCRALVLNWPKERTASISLISDCTSAIPGFENMADEFLSFMKENGCKVQTTRDWLS